MKNKKKKLLKSGLKRRKRAKKKRSIIPSKHYYEFKGKKAEEVLNMLANNTFLMDWCFPNPKRMSRLSLKID
jgi:hypothetical protein